MNIVTKLFGEVEVDVTKVITFDAGIIGFEDFKQYMLIHDSEKSDNSITWLQSIDDPDLALPVISPLLIKRDYNPFIEDELLSSLGGIKESELLALITITIPSDITKMTVNLKAPLLINTSNLKACQIIVDEDYEVRYPIYDILKADSGKDGE